MTKILRSIKEFFENRHKANSIVVAVLTLTALPIFHADAGLGNFIQGQAMQLVNELMVIFIGAGAYFLTFAAGLFDRAINFSAAGFKTVSGSLLYDLWGVFRDVANVFFIFVLLIIAIATILRLESYGIKRLLPTLIIVALFINFSLLISQYIIYPANWLSYDIAASILTTTGAKDMKTALEATFLIHTLPTGKEIVDKAPSFIQSLATGCVLGVVGSVVTGGILAPVGCLAGGAIGAAAHLVVTAAFGTGADLKKQAEIFTAQAAVLGVIIVTTFTLLAGAIMVIARTVILMLLMIVSPLAFLAHAIPGAQGYARKWWSMMLNQAWFLPIYLLVMSLGIQISREITKEVAGKKLTLIERPDLMFFYILNVIIFLAGLVIAKQMGAYGAGIAIKYGQQGYRMAGGYAGRLSKRTFVGRPARAVSESRIAQSVAATFPRTLGKAYQLAEKGAKAGGLGKSEEAQVALLQSLGAEHRARTLANMSQRAQDQALEKMSARDIADMKERARGTTYAGAIDRATGRISVEKREKVEEETAKVMARNATNMADLAGRFRSLTPGAQQSLMRDEKELIKALNRLAPTVSDLANGFAALPDEIQRTYLQGSSKEDIQALAKEYDRRGGAQGLDFVTRVNRMASKRNSEVFAVLPGYANNAALGPNAVQYRDMVPRMDMAKTSAGHITGTPGLMDSVVRYSGMKQIREIRDRNDAVTAEYDRQMQAMWTTVGKNKDMMAAQFRAFGNNALAMLIETNEEARKYIGLT